MKQFTILAAALTALVAMTLTATAVHARCTVGDITMTKSAPAGNLSRTDIPRTSAVIHFELPSDCPIATPPLKACVNVWDTGNPSGKPFETSGMKRGFSTTGGWEPGGFGTVCNANFLLDNNGTVATRLPLLFDLYRDTPGPNPPHYLVLVMHNPTRYLKIPIDP